MGSLGGEVVQQKRAAMWLYPKVTGVHPSERWGHSACYSDGLIYMFGGCCGGVHFSDVLVLNLETMAWNTLVTTGQGPGPRDSHSAVLVGHKMIVFGGTNGCKKVNDLHMLDLRSREWMQPACHGKPPSPRESHTATLISDDKFVIFGGSGEGEANYLNDLHILDLKTMTWTSPEVGGDMPVPRDSHSAVAIGNRLFVFGGDCGDRYNGDVDVFDMDTLAWSRLKTHGPSPGVRAGHVSVNFGKKIYTIGGVGDKKYYNDVWVLDAITCSWTQVEIRGQNPQGRFSHAAIFTDFDIVIYGGCGEDERPLNELLILQLGVERPTGSYNISIRKILGNQCNRMSDFDNNMQKVLFKSKDENLITNRRELELSSRESLSDTLHLKRRRTNYLKAYDVESEPEEHSLSLSQSQQSSPSQSDHEQTPQKKATEILSVTASNVLPLFNQQNSKHCQQNLIPRNQASSQSIMQRRQQDLQLFGESLNQPKRKRFMDVVTSRHEGRRQVADYKPEAGQFQNMIGAELYGKVDGAFDSGYLMTATVNGKIFRGVLFAPGPDVISRGDILAQNPWNFSSQVAVNHEAPLNHCARHPQRPTKLHTSDPGEIFRPSQMRRSSSTAIRDPLSLCTDQKLNNELQGVFLTLGGPGSGLGRS